jgi:hypothetical protein
VLQDKLARTQEQLSTVTSRLAAVLAAHDHGAAAPPGAPAEQADMVATVTQLQQRVVELETQLEVQRAGARGDGGQRAARHGAAAGQARAQRYGYAEQDGGGASTSGAREPTAAAGGPDAAIMTRRLSALEEELRKKEGQAQKLATMSQVRACHLSPALAHSCIMKFCSNLMSSLLVTWLQHLQVNHDVRCRRAASRRSTTRWSQT